ncbi:MAG: tetratricopeptide repeat protein, partial [Methylobacterium sp.]
MTDVRPRRTRSVLALTFAASVSLCGQAFAVQPRESMPVSEYEPAESLEGNFLSAYIAGASRDTAAAASFYREAVKADPRNTDLAIQAYSDFDALMPRHPIVRDALDKLKAGKPLARLVTTAQEGAGEVLYGLGSAGSTQGDELPAVVYLRLALYLAPEHALARLTLADTLDRMKQPEKANEAYAQIPATSPLKLNADIQIGLNLEQAGKGDEALQYLDAAMKAHPDDIDIITALGNVQRSRKKYEEAAETYSRAIALIGDRPQSNFWTTYYFRGTAYERAKQWPKAEADLKKALELVPASQPAAKAQVLNYLGYSWVDQKINIDDAFKLLKQAADASPRDGMIVDSLGWAYFRLGRWDDAVRELEKAVELKPGDPTINDHLG